VRGPTRASPAAVHVTENPRMGLPPSEVGVCQVMVAVLQKPPLHPGNCAAATLVGEDGTETMTAGGEGTTTGGTGTGDGLGGLLDGGGRGGGDRFKLPSMFHLSSPEPESSATRVSSIREDPHLTPAALTNLLHPVARSCTTRRRGEGMRERL